MANNTDYTPSLALCRLYECTSKKGNVYLRGRMGLVNVVVLKTEDVSDTGQPIWVMKVQEPTPRQDEQRPRADAATRASAERGFERDPADPGIPF